MAIAKWGAEAHGGIVEPESKPTGSVFRLLLPFFDSGIACETVGTRQNGIPKMRIQEEASRWFEDTCDARVPSNPGE